MRLGSMSEHLRRRVTSQVFEHEVYVHDSSVTFTVTLRSLTDYMTSCTLHKTTVTRPPWQPSAVIHFASLTRLIHANRNSHHFHDCFIPTMLIKHVAETCLCCAVYASKCFVLFKNHSDSPAISASGIRSKCSSPSPHNKGVCGSGGTVSLILNLGARCGWMVSFKPRPLYSR